MKTECNELIEGCRESCRRCLALVDSLTPEQYTLSIGGRSAIGAHMRHCAEHFLCFFHGLAGGRVNYDARERDLALETDPSAIRAALSRIEEQLAALADADPDQPIIIEVTAASGSEPRALASSIGRELAFLSSHNIHHLALMTVLADLAGGKIDESIGLAYSTESHQARGG